MLREFSSKYNITRTKKDLREREVKTGVRERERERDREREPKG